MRFFSKTLSFVVAAFALSSNLNAAELPTIKEIRYEGLNYISPLIANEIAGIACMIRLKIQNRC